MTAGRPPLGPKLVDNLEGSDSARARLRIVLETISGERSVEDACSALGIGDAAFYKMRTKALAAALESLEPGTPGRPRVEEPAEAFRVRELEEQVQELKVDLKAAEIREEIALTMPHLLNPGGAKKNETRSQSSSQAGWTGGEKKRPSRRR